WIGARKHGRRLDEFAALQLDTPDGAVLDTNMRDRRRDADGNAEALRGSGKRADEAADAAQRNRRTERPLSHRLTIDEAEHSARRKRPFGRAAYSLERDQRLQRLRLEGLL